MPSYEDLERQVAELRGALERNRQGLRNILEFRKIAGYRTGDHEYPRYGALTREEIEQSIAEIDAALASSSRAVTERPGYWKCGNCRWCWSPDSNVVCQNCKHPRGQQPDCYCEVPTDIIGPCPRHAAPAVTEKHPDSGWRSMDTAPKDGRWILCYDATSGEMRVACRKLFFDISGRYEWFRDDIHVPGQTWSLTPTHWMPLPQPPSAMQASPATPDTAGGEA